MFSLTSVALPLALPTHRTLVHNGRKMRRMLTWKENIDTCHLYAMTDCLSVDELASELTDCLSVDELASELTDCLSVDELGRQNYCTPRSGAVKVIADGQEP